MRFFFFLLLTICLVSCAKKTDYYDEKPEERNKQTVIHKVDSTPDELNDFSGQTVNEINTQETNIISENHQTEDKDYTKENFSEYFDDSITNYKFYIRNPLFISNAKYDSKSILFFERPEMMINKILKVTRESYKITPDGTKSWGDSDKQSFECDYYFFDSDFRISDRYYFFRIESGYYFYKTHDVYKGNKFIYTITTKNEKMGKLEYSNIVYQINKNVDDIELKRTDNNEYMIFSKKNIIEENKTYYINYELVLNKMKQIRILDNEEQYQSHYYYENGGEIKRKFYTPKETSEYTYEKVEQDKYIEYFIENESEEKIPKRVITRRFNPIGFMEYEFTRPYESTEGNYSIMTAEVLDEPDELFKEAFDENWYNYR